MFGAGIPKYPEGFFLEDSRNPGRVRRAFRQEAKHLTYDVILKKEIDIRRLYEVRGDDITPNSLLDRSVREEVIDVHMLRAMELAQLLRELRKPCQGQPDLHDDKKRILCSQELTQHTRRLADLKDRPDMAGVVDGMFVDYINGKRALENLRLEEVFPMRARMARPKPLLYNRTLHLRLV